MPDNTAVLNSPPTAGDAPLFSALDTKTCEAILARNSVGRIAFSLHDRVSIVPIHYVYASGWIYGRTAAAGKLEEILRNRRVAFEVDEHTELFEWRSVVASGPLYLIGPGTTPSERRVYTTAAALIRQLAPSALTDSDPVPFRDQLFRVRVAEISGRASRPTGGAKVFSRSGKTTADSGEPDLDATVSEQVERALGEVALSAGSRVHVEVFDGVVVLTGITEDSAQRSAVEAAVLGVSNVRAVVQELETSYPLQPQPTPSEIAREAVRQLRLSPRIVDPAIRVVAEHGWLRLEGVASSRKSREDAVRRLRSIKGSRGVIDMLRVIEPATAQVVTG